MGALIFSHVDCDGILSARIAQLGLPNSKVKFQNWSGFGLTESNKNEIVEMNENEKLDRFVGLDLGSDEVTFDQLASLHDETGIPCLWLDHHPTDYEMLKKYAGKDVTIVNQQGTCTAAMAYEMFSVNAPDEVKKYWQGFWAILGIYGDVAQEGEKSGPLLKRLAPDYPELLGKQIFWTAGKGNSTFEIPMMIARYWNTVRRLTFQYGCPVGLRACAEIERTNKPFALMEPFDEVLEAQMPNTFMLQKWQDMYVAERSSVFKADNMKFFDFNNFSASIFKHRWDVGGYVSSIKAGDPLFKSHFAINMGLKEFIKVTGRNPGKPKDKAKLPPVNLDLGATFRELGVGGGHAVAASGGYPLGTSPTKIIKDLCDIVNKRISEGREKMQIGGDVVQEE